MREIMGRISGDLGGPIFDFDKLIALSPENPLCYVGRE